MNNWHIEIGGNVESFEMSVVFQNPILFERLVKDQLIEVITAGYRIFTQELPHVTISMPVVFQISVAYLCNSLFSRNLK